MTDFITALQFLTRIRVRRQDQLTPASFGRSVRFFPLVGALIGAILASFYYFAGEYLSVHVLAALIIIFDVLLTGGIHYDGLMDTMDGLFSGRPRERMLEIMKDSRVGAMGVIAFGMLLMLKWSMLLDLFPVKSVAAIFLMPVLGRFAMIIGITIFPYARPEGMGKAFAEHAGQDTLFFATAITILLVLSFGKAGVVSLAIAAGFAVFFSRFVTKKLGGLTGDVYGALLVITEILVLAVFLFEREWQILWLR
jgi:adenosylcobinamide-GDP ribazoletransferase